MLRTNFPADLWEKSYGTFFVPCVYRKVDDLVHLHPSIAAYNVLSRCCILVAVNRSGCDTLAAVHIRFTACQPDT